MPSQEPVLLAREVALFPWEAWGALHLVECLPTCLPSLVTACLPGLGVIACMGKTFPCRIVRETVLPVA